MADKPCYPRKSNRCKYGRKPEIIPQHEIQFMEMLIRKLRCGSIGHLIDMYADISAAQEGRKVYFAELKKKLGLV